jgi:hypothetical protein
MDATGVWLFVVLNLLILGLTVGLLGVFFYLGRARQAVFAHLVDVLEALGFAKRGWTRQPQIFPFQSAAGYYSGTFDEKPFEVHFYAVGGRRFKLIPYVEFVLLGYFNANLSISTPNWDVSRLDWIMPKRLNLPGYNGLELRTAHESSAKILLGNEQFGHLVRQLLASNMPALLTIAPRDLHLTFRLGQPEQVSVAALQGWLRGMAKMAEMVSTLPPLAPEEVYESYARMGPRPPSPRSLVFLFIVLLIGLVLLGLAGYLIR